MVPNSDTEIGETNEARFVSHAFVDQHLAEPVEIRTAVGTVVAFTARSPEHEDRNEDAALVLSIGTGAALLVVADGFGGHPSGAEAARLAVTAMEAALRNRDPEDELRTAVLNGFEMANETVRSLGVGAATTLAVVEVQQEWARPYHVGDSGIVVVGQRGRVKARTVDHSPTGYAVEAGLMDDREAVRHEERHLVSNMVGSAEMRIEIGANLHLAARDTVLLASDGLFDNQDLSDILNTTRKGPLKANIAALATSSRRRMGRPTQTGPSKPDDITILAYRPDRRRPR